jgi:AGCS family alanine or glycine:cation symporter
MTQASSIASLIHENFKIDTWVSGACLAIFSAVVIIGGIKSIAQVCVKLVPLMAIFYMVSCLIIIVLNIDFLLPSIKLIVKSAFSARAAGGGFIGASVLMALRYGAVRGLHPNDAGLGTTPIAAAAAQTENPVNQALISSTGTFWDSVVIGALTSLVFVTSILKHPAAMRGLDPENLIEAVFAQIPDIGPSLLTITLICFVFSTILGWTYYCERAVEYLFRRRSIPIFRYFWVIAIFFGAILKPPDESSFTRFITDFSMAAVALMAIPNLIALLFLHKVITAETKKYLWDFPKKIEVTSAPPAREERPSINAASGI